MKKMFGLLVTLSLFQFGFSQAGDSIMIRSIANNILLKGKAYDDLRFLCKNVGARLSGSPNAQKAVEATAKMLQEAGADTVYLQPCMVPHWVRGEKEQGIFDGVNIKNR